MRLPSNLGMFCLSIWLIVQGALAFIPLGTRLISPLMSLLAIAAGVLLLMKK